MGAPNPEMTAADMPSAESLLGALKTIQPSEKLKHASVLDYWLSIRGDREFPPLHDLDPLEISDAGPSSVLLELIGGGEDAEVRHLGAALKTLVESDRIATAPRPSILASIAKKLSIVAISRNFLAFEDEFTIAEETTRCWVTLYPLSAAGAWVDYVYALVSFESRPAEETEITEGSDALDGELEPQEPLEQGRNEQEPIEQEPIEQEQVEPEPVEQGDQSSELESAIEIDEPLAQLEPDQIEESAGEQAAPRAVAGAGKVGPGFTKLLESLAGLGGFYATHAAEAEVSFPSEPVGAEPDGEAMPIVPEQMDELGQEQADGAGGQDNHSEDADSLEEAAATVTEPEIAEEESEEPVSIDREADRSAVDEEREQVEVTGEEADQPVEAVQDVTKSTLALEGSLQSKLADVRTKADEARLAKLRANAALYEGLSAAYDFALDAEEAPEEYLQIVQAQGLKIQLRSPMKPVVKLAFEGLCDESTIGQLEAVLAWALKQELPRGTLAERLEAEGGIARVLNGEAKAA